jgi:23S rRNA (adenine2503-C2)-methyltransferase
VSRYDLSRQELGALLAGEPAYRVTQIYEGMHRRLAAPEELTELPRELRARLAGDASLAPALRVERRLTADRGTTVKWLFALADGAAIETVLMHYPGRSTVCVSTQAGCAMACSFCATGQGGFRRNLTVGEIVEQVVVASRAAADSGRRLANVVMMGMGEPLANVGRMWPAVAKLNVDLGIAARHITISTVGIVPGIRRLAREPLQVNLAVSLHAANDELRNRLVPVNLRYPLAMLAQACGEYVAATRRRLSLEWAMIDSVNDSGRDAAELAAFALPLRAHVNLIPLNRTAGFDTPGSPPERVASFRELLEAHGVNVTVRRNRGLAIDAACGQLAAPVGARMGS